MLPTRDAPLQPTATPSAQGSATESALATVRSDWPVRVKYHLIAEHLLDHVGERDDPGRPPVLVHDDGEVRTAAAELAEEVGDLLRLRHEDGLPHEGAHAALDELLGEDVLGVEDAHDAVEGPLVD